MKKVFSVVFVFVFSLSASFLYGQNYESLLQQADLAYKNNNEIEALNGYWNAMKCSLGEKNEAYEQFNKIAEDIKKPIEITDTCDEFDIYEIWKKRLMSFEEYYTRHIPFTITISPLEQKSLDYEKKTGTFTFSINIKESKKYQVISNIYLTGLAAIQKEIAGFPSISGWPGISIFNSFDEAKQKNVFLALNTDSSEPAYQNALLRKYFNIDLSWYDKSTNEIITTCQIYIYQKDNYTIEVTDIPQAVIQKIKKNMITCRVDAISLRYGEYAPKTISKDNGYTTYNSSGKAIIHVPSKYWEEENPNYKPMTEINVPVKSVSIHLPYIQYKSDINPIIIANGMNFFSVKGDSIQTTALGYFHVDDFYACETPVSIELFKEIMGSGYYYPYNETYIENINFKSVMRFCNKLSTIMGYEPCYSFYGETDPDKWIEYPVIQSDGGYTEEESLLVQQWDNFFYCNVEANGFRIPTYKEALYMWQKELVPLIKEWCWYKPTGVDTVLQPSIFYGEKLYDNSLHVWQNTSYHMPYYFRLVRSSMD